MSDEAWVAVPFKQYNRLREVVGGGTFATGITYSTDGYHEIAVAAQELIQEVERP